MAESYVPGVIRLVKIKRIKKEVGDIKPRIKMTYLDGSPGDCLPECLEDRDKMYVELEVLKDALEKIYKACTHEWLEDKEQKMNAESRQRMFMACVKDCRRISRNALQTDD